MHMKHLPWLLVLITAPALLFNTQGLCQIVSPPIVGGTGGLSVSTDRGRFDAAGPPRQHKSPDNTPCIKVHGLSRREIVNPTIYEHVLILENACSQPIKLRLCYYPSTDCISTTVTAYSRRQQILGIAPNTPDFRYAYTEDF